MKNILIITMLLGLVWGCGNSSEDNQSANHNTDTTAMLTIDGMTCEIGCAARIEDKLSKMEGIESATIDFETKVATVSYNHSSVDEKKMVQMIEDLNDKQYSVTNVEVEKEISENMETSGSGESGSILSIPSIELPNILKFITNII